MEIVKLANGKTVSWDEFSAWSSIKQKMSINPPNKGRKFNEEFKEKIREARRRELHEGTRVILKGGEHKNARRVITPFGVFASLKDAASHYSVRGDTMRNWIKSNKTGFYFDSQPLVRKRPSKKGGVSGAENKSSRSVVTPAGVFPSIKSAAAHYGITDSVLSKMINDESNNEFKYESHREKRKIGINPNAKVVVTPAGTFNSISEAAKHYGICGEGMRYRIRSKSQPDFYYGEPEVTFLSEHGRQ